VKLLNRTSEQPIAHAVIADPEQHTVMDASGAVRSIQAANVDMPMAELDAIWTPEHLERLARTYWKYLSRVTLGLIRVVYTESERAVVLLRRPFVLLRFHAPEYELEPDRGTVTWRIEKGLLVAPMGRGKGFLRLTVERLPPPGGDSGRLVNVVVSSEVANFYPTIGGWGWFARIGGFLYRMTQLRIHVIVTNAFLRSLARLDLEPSVVGRLRRRAIERSPWGHEDGAAPESEEARAAG
jgi:hypothetical protein